MKKPELDSSIGMIHQLNVDLEKNELYLVGEESYSYGSGEEGIVEPGVDYIMATRLIKNLQVVSERLIVKNKYKPILIHMKTDGGDFSEGMAIYDALKACPNPTIIVNYTHARSMSSIIFQAADRRVMMPHSTFMFHRGTYSMSGTLQEVESNWEFDRRDDQIMLEIYASRMKDKGAFAKQSKTKIKEWLKDQMMRKTDVYMTAEQAVKYGLADEIFTSWRSLRK